MDFPFQVSAAVLYFHGQLADGLSSRPHKRSAPFFCCQKPDRSSTLPGKSGPRQAIAPGDFLFHGVDKRFKEANREQRVEREDLWERSKGILCALTVQEVVGIFYGAEYLQKQCMEL